MSWQCPRCTRTFAIRNQHHFCTEYPNTIDAYIDAQPEPVRPRLRAVRDAIRAVLPQAQERISWRMPTYWDRRNIIHFAAFKNHLGLYPGEEGVAHFTDRLAGYRASKGAIQFPYDRPLPLELIAEIAAWCRDAGNQP